MSKVVSVPAAVSAGKIVGTISFFSFAPIRPMLNVGEPTITVVAEEGDDDSVCCAGAEVVLSALLLLLLLPLLPLPSAAWTVEEDTVPGGRTFAITPVAIADPLLLISILNGLTTPGSALTIGYKLDSVPCVLVLVGVVTTAVLRITLPVSRNGISSVVDFVSSSSCSATLK
jgi:hypothetical protein